MLTFPFFHHRGHRERKSPTIPLHFVCFQKKLGGCTGSQARRQAGDMCYEIEDEHAHTTYPISHTPYHPTNSMNPTNPLSLSLTLDSGLLFNSTNPTNPTNPMNSTNPYPIPPSLRGAVATKQSLSYNRHCEER